jgi:DNA-binding transcriptional LysR family regulator
MAKAGSKAPKSRAVRDWNDIQYVLAVADEGSFRGAGDRLATHQTTVSRRVESLEQELKAKLFVRRSHGMILTAAGRALVAKAKEMEQAVSALSSDVAGLDTRLTGVVRIQVLEGIGITWMTPTMMDFRVQFPDISLELSAGIYPADLLAGEADISVTMLRPTDPRLVMQRVGTSTYALFASRKYLRDFGSPESLEDLKHHKLVSPKVYGTNPRLKWWSDLVLDSDGVTFITNSTGLFFAAVQEGFGVGLIPTFYQHVAPDLTMLPIPTGCHVDLWMVTHEATNKSAKVRAVTSFLKSRFTRDRARWFT